MKKHITASIFALMLGGLVSAQAYADDMGSALKSAAHVFKTAFADNNPAAVAGLYTKDATLLPPNHAMLSGKDNIHTFWQGVIKAGVHEIKLETVNIEEQNDTAIEIGLLQLKDSNGKALDNGKYIVVWKKKNGTWKYHRDIWNSDNAPQ